MRILLLIGVLLISDFASAQDNIVPKKYITLIPIRCILRDVSFGYAHQINKVWTLEERVGWVHANKFLHKYYNNLMNSTEMRFQGPSVYFQFNRWRANKKGRRTFFGVITGYRYLFYNNKEMHVYDSDGRSYDRDIVLSQWRNDLLLLTTFGVGTSDYTMTEISFGMRFMFTHYNVSAINRPSYNFSQEQYNGLADATMDMVPYADGFGMAPVFRITSRIGWIKWE